MKIKLHFDFKGKEPILIGIALDKFGWVIGGGRTGKLVMDGTIVFEENAADDTLAKKLKRALRDYDYHARGQKTFSVEE